MTPGRLAVRRAQANRSRRSARHGIAANRQAVAVDHEKGAVAVICPIEFVGKAGVDRKIVLGQGIHQFYCNRIEAFGSLTIAFMELRTKVA